MQDSETLTVDKLRAASYSLSGFGYRVSQSMPDNMMLWLRDELVVPACIDELIKGEWDFARAIEHIQRERPDVQLIDLRNTRRLDFKTWEKKNGR